MSSVPVTAKNPATFGTSQVHALCEVIGSAPFQPSLRRGEALIDFVPKNLQKDFCCLNVRLLTFKKYPKKSLPKTQSNLFFVVQLSEFNWSVAPPSLRGHSRPRWLHSPGDAATKFTMELPWSKNVVFFLPCCGWFLKILEKKNYT